MSSAGDAASPLVGVLALQGDVREHVAALTAAGARVRLVRAAQDLDGLDGIVVPGGESTVIGRLLEVFSLLQPLRDRLAGGLPAYGSCAGMVLLADEVVDGLPGQPLLGGLDVTVRRNAFGTQVHSFEARLPLDGLAEPVHAVFIRAPWVERTGDDVEVLAEVGGHPVAVRQGRLLATSFHPELTGDARVHALFVDLVRETSAAAAGARPSAPTMAPTTDRTGATRPGPTGPSPARPAAAGARATGPTTGGAP